MKRYELTGESKVNAWGVTVYRIRALVDIPRFGVKKGDLGGWVESELLRNGDARVFGAAWVFGAARVSGAAQVTEAWHCLHVGPIGSENVTATLYRTKNGKHRLHVGCWEGTLGTLMAEVNRRRESWAVDAVQQELWVAQYKALKLLGKATVARWEAAK